MSLTHRQKIDVIVEAMATWSYEELLAWAQDARRDFLLAASRAAVDEEYEDARTDPPALPPVADASQDPHCPVCDARNVHQHDPPLGWECHDCGAEWTRLIYPKTEGGTNR